MESKFKQHENIDSVKYRVKIKELVNKFDLKGRTGITNFCVCISFRDNKKYFLSNMPDWAIEYHKIGGARSDEVFDLGLMKNKNHFFPRCSKYDDVQKSLVCREEHEFKYFDSYSLIRRCIDCTIILLALHDKPAQNPQRIYDETRNEFEEFCIFFLSNMLDEIKVKNDDRKGLLIFNNIDFLSEVIRCGVIKETPTLTKREKECIKLLINNYPPKLIARSMLITEKAVRNYIESIRQKLGCTSTLDIVETAIQYDL